MRTRPVIWDERLRCLSIPSPTSVRCFGRELETVELVAGGAEDVRQDLVLFRKPE